MAAVFKLCYGVGCLLQGQANQPTYDLQINFWRKGKKRKSSPRNLTFQMEHQPFESMYVRRWKWGFSGLSCWWTQGCNSLRCQPKQEKTTSVDWISGVEKLYWKSQISSVKSCHWFLKILSPRRIEAGGLLVSNKHEIQFQVVMGNESL